MRMQWKLTVGAAITALALGAQAESFDVVVIGSGGAGLSAGIMAKEAGAKTVVLEKQAYLGPRKRAPRPWCSKSRPISAATPTSLRAA